MKSATERKAHARALSKTRETRINNLRWLCEHFGSQSELARRLGVGQQRIVSLCGPNPSRALGEEAARAYEQTLGLSAGWLDIPR